MAKYYREKDVERIILDLAAESGRLPTIEVSEDCISRKRITDRIILQCELNDEYDVQHILEDIKNASSVVPIRAEDDVEIVRCEDCIYYDKKKLGFRKCTQSGLHVTDEDYCSYGERTEE